MKKIWMTSLDSSKENVQALMANMKKYGLEVDGHFWKDDPEKPTWPGFLEGLLDPKNAVWVIMGSDQQMMSPDALYGLSMLGIALKAGKGSGFPVVLLQTAGEPVLPDHLPTILKSADVLSITNPALGAKLTAKANMPVKHIPSEYRMDVYGNEQIGQWIEVGPEDAAWKGCMFGVAGGEIKFQAVGPKGELPPTSTLNYPVQGMKVTLGETDYQAWAVQNDIDPESSYFVKIEGAPASIIFSSYSTDEETDVYVVKLKN